MPCFIAQLFFLPAEDDQHLKKEDSPGDSMTPDGTKIVSPASHKDCIAHAYQEREQNAHPSTIKAFKAKFTNHPQKSLKVQKAKSCSGHILHLSRSRSLKRNDVNERQTLRM